MANVSVPKVLFGLIYLIIPGILLFYPELVTEYLPDAWMLAAIIGIIAFFGLLFDISSESKAIKIITILILLAAFAYSIYHKWDFYLERFAMIDDQYLAKEGTFYSTSETVFQAKTGQVVPLLVETLPDVALFEWIGMAIPMLIMGLIGMKEVIAYAAIPKTHTKTEYASERDIPENVEAMVNRPTAQQRAAKLAAMKSSNSSSAPTPAPVQPAATSAPSEPMVPKSGVIMPNWNATSNGEPIIKAAAPTEVPETPVAPVIPETPVAPVQEAPKQEFIPNPFAQQPATPVAPVEPVIPETPVAPVQEAPKQEFIPNPFAQQPVTPVAPVAPVVPETPVAPVVPETPVVPVVPETPVAPVVPETPVAPVTPSAPPVNANPFVSFPNPFESSPAPAPTPQEVRYPSETAEQPVLTKIVINPEPVETQPEPPKPETVKVVLPPLMPTASVAAAQTKPVAKPAAPKDQMSDEDKNRIKELQKQVAELKTLYNQGMITQDEYIAQRTAILQQMYSNK